ncbi:2Fe-2S ferredoxin [Bradyrhizobium sp. GM2.2]|uniref:2Fe-2S iron-sulfur cluster-binding protein n=1 Tax=Bradyrhizobium sp. GM2.2 TaxID=3156358 RepID=UPI003398D67F
MKLLITNENGQVTELDGVSAKTLMQAIRDAGLNLTAQCGGCLSCGTCHVYVHPTWWPKLIPPTEFESGMLDVVDDRRETSRLSCQIDLSKQLDGLEVTIAPGSAFS